MFHGRFGYLTCRDGAFQLFLNPTFVGDSLSCGDILTFILFEPSHEKTNNLGFRPGPTKTGLYSHIMRLEA